MPKYLITYTETYAKKLAVVAIGKEEAREAAKQFLSGYVSPHGLVSKKHYPRQFIEWNIDEVSEINPTK